MYTNVFFPLLNPSDHVCNELPSTSAIQISIFMILGTFLSYVPQQVKIIKNKTSYGISPYYVLLGSLGAISNIFNYILLNFWAFDCCKMISTGRCLIKMLGVILVCIQSFQSLSVFLLVVWYFPRDKRYVANVNSVSENTESITAGAHLPLSETTPLVSTHSEASEDAVPRVDNSSLVVQKSRRLEMISFMGQHYTPEYQITLLVFISVIVYTVFCTIVSTTFAYFSGAYSFYTITWAKFLGLFSLFVTIVQFVPQIHKTYKLKQVGSLSIPMMLIQSPGGFVFAYILAVQPNSNWTSWVSTFFAAFFQMSLLLLCLFLIFTHKPTTVSTGVETD